MSFNLETERLLIRSFKSEDLDDAMGFWGNEEVMKYCGGQGSRERVNKSMEFYNNLHKEKGFATYAVSLKENNRVIGACGFNPGEADDEIELIYHFAKEYWGKGYATEAAKACVAYAGSNLEIKKIVASVDHRHETSKKILEKLGFDFIGMKLFDDTGQEEPCYELVM